MYCDSCRRLFWEGTHWRSMRALLAPLVEQLDADPPP
jgi:uncharacterized protein with PIN domain